MLKKLRSYISFEYASEIPEHFTGVCVLRSTYVMLWIKNGYTHRDNDLPAIISFDEKGQIAKYTWMYWGNIHRVGAPARMSYFEPHEHWLNGQYYTKENFWKQPVNIKHKLDMVLKQL